ncbi:MAG: SpoVR family protein [Planctomycetes bacterium]|nr:SpoVR family protein [Planctomycetota bacterium]
MTATGLTAELAETAAEIRRHAKDYGLDFFEVVFEMLSSEQINMVAAYGGFPTRYPHWRFGMAYDELQKGYVFGLQRIYELVINNDPCYAYLMKGNSLVDQKLVMAHVYGHADFFRNNCWFRETNRKMMDEFANHGVRVRRYIERYGLQAVEEFLESCLSLENLIDIHSPFIQRRAPGREEEPEIHRTQPARLRAKSYMDSFVNPPDAIEAERRRLEQETQKRHKFPEERQRDVLLFLIENAPLERWQKDILSIIREEAYYFAPQAMTKIMNEGWASYWHSTIMTEKVCNASEIVDYADHHARTMGTQPGQLNPYKIGLELYRDIEDRWNRGRFGPEWESCDSAEKKAAWNLDVGLGRDKIFEVRAIYNDITFIDEFLTEEFCERHKLFTFEYSKQSQAYVIQSRDFKEIKQKLLFELTNAGQPFICVEDANYKNRGELYLYHDFQGVPLKADSARETLAHLFKIWGRPVHVETATDRRRKLLTFDGSRHEEKFIK